MTFFPTLRQIFLLGFIANAICDVSCKTESGTLEVVLVASGDDDVVDLEDHTAELCGQQKLLSLGDQGVDNEVFSHVCEQVSHCVHIMTI